MLNRFRYMISNRLIRGCEGKEIRKEELINYIRQDAIIIDVRSTQEYREGHIDGAISIPDYKMKKEIERQISNKNQLIVLYCETGRRSKKSQCLLLSMGYINVYNVKDGIII